jgi:hypothetical protein
MPRTVYRRWTVEDRSDPYESTARWLEESARRRAASCPARVELAPPPLPPAKRRRERTVLGISREIYMFAVLAAAYLNYYFMQVMIEVGSLPGLVVFYPLQ